MMGQPPVSVDADIARRADGFVWFGAVTSTPGPVGNDGDIV